MASPGSHERPRIRSEPRAWARQHALTATGLVVAVTVFGLALRFVLLGDRIAHWDEGRVGYWIVYYQETGSFAYRRIIHGPFIQHVNRWLFPILGANDFTMRLPVAIVGGLLPATALLFREHLRRVEMAVMALFLALNPVLLYYSRFMRSDVLVATFMFAAFGFLVRFYDTRRFRYVYAAAALMAAGFAAKENAIIYVATWIGAAGLLADQALYRPRGHDSGADLLWSKVSAARERSREAPAVVRARVVDYSFHLVMAGVLFVFLSLFFYAPRGAGVDGLNYPPADPATTLGFWEAVANPVQLPTLVLDTWNYVQEEFVTWVTQADETGENETLTAQYAEFLGRYVEVMGTRAAALSVFAVIGFLYERYGRDRSRNLVMFAAYGGFVSVLGYPLGTDIFGAWIVVHALVPLSIPAAVGLSRVADWGREALAADDRVGVTAAVVVLLVVVAQFAVVGGPAVYQHDQSDSNTLVQYAQPGDDPREELRTIREVAADGDGGTDVLLYYGEPDERYDDGSALVEQDPSGWNSSSMNYRPLCSKWFNTLPLPWYFASADADVACERSDKNLSVRAVNDQPPVVITARTDSTVPEDILSEHYERESYEMRSYGTEMTFWVHESHAEGDGA
ncbi:flippase activity-associated protein Agl23 [Halomicrobium salinisoli]|uniref:flippase activity-associated protein Agl23 n=1 Tax=Halomicrobium salinisoli TaxID=2878391 RepID=UPI001CF058D6|nr:flippase activity-associated protein Agl23 [Halomicrobium salinisoli]